MPWPEDMNGPIDAVTRPALQPVAATRPAADRATSPDAPPRPLLAAAVRASEEAERLPPEDAQGAAKALQDAINDRLERLFSSNLRLRIDTDRDTGAFVYQSIDRDTGEVQKQWPPEKILRLMAFFRELDGLLIDAEV